MSHSRTRLVHISPGTDVGGMEKLLVQFARFTDRERFDLTFMSLQQRGEVADEIEDMGWPVISLNKPLGLRPSLVARIAHQLRRLRAEVVHTHNDAALVYGVPAAVIARVPRVIHTRHGQRVGATSRQTRLCRWLSRWVDCMVSVSEDSRQLSIAEGVDANRTRTIHNGVDLSRFPCVGPDPQRPAVLVARLNPVKNVETLIRALALIRSRVGVGDRPLYLDIVGDGPERASLESLSSSLGLDSLIRFRGVRGDIPAILGDSSMFVLPSITEGISLSLLEAMSSGLPVVACRVGGNPEVVIDHSTGYLVPARDPEALATALLRLHQNPTLAAQLGRCGRRRSEQEFSIELMVDRYQQLYAAAHSDTERSRQPVRMAG